MKSKKKILGWWIGIVVVVIAMVSVYLCNRPKTSTGSKNVELEVVDNDNNTQIYTIHTDAAVLTDVMDELASAQDFSYEGTSSSLGYYIETVNGVTADYTKDGSYWAIYVNGDYGQYSADTQPVNDNDIFKLSYEH